MKTHNSESGDLDELISLLNQVLSDIRSDIARLTHQCKELKNRIDTIEGKPTSQPLSNAPLTVVFRMEM